VIQKPEDRDRVLTWCRTLEQDIAAQGVRVHVDARDMRGPEKKWQWIKKGAPIRLEVGPRDIDKDSVAMNRRDKDEKATFVPRAEFIANVTKTLADIQQALFDRAKAFRTEHTKKIDTKDDFYAYFTAPKTKNENDPTPIHGGFALTHFDGDPALEKTIKDDLGVTVRCIPLDKEIGGEPGTCPFTGKPSKQRVVWAKAY
jgi:prolyl-tRNA synthetase